MTDFVMPKGNAVTMSEAAIAHFKNIAAGKVVKFGVEGGSCAGLKYAWSIIEDIADLYDDDEIINYNDFTLAVDGASLLFVIGCQIDYVSDITGSRIEIVNPNAKASCGCGESFSAA